MRHDFFLFYIVVQFISIIYQVSSDVFVRLSLLIFYQYTNHSFSQIKLCKSNNAEKLTSN